MREATTRRLWGEFRRHIRAVYEVDRKFLAKEGGMVPTYHLAFLCDRCDKLWWAVAVCAGPVEAVRAKGRQAVLGVVADVCKKGCGCGGKLLPVGYLFASEAWVVVARRGERIIGDIPPSKHPRRVEIYFMEANTVFGRAALAQAEIWRRGGKVELDELQVNESTPDQISGSLHIPLPQVGPQPENGGSLDE